MELELIRTYFPYGTNGELYLDGKLVCYTIELPWLNNKRKKSCIPEGRYAVVKRYSVKYKHHLLLTGVPGRTLILIHPANDAMKELQGCIAPVSMLVGEGRGIRSRVAMEKILSKVYPLLNEGQTIFIQIKTKRDEAD